MSYAPKLQPVNALIQKLRGYVAVVGGQTWSVFRLGAGSNQNGLLDTPVLTNFQSKIKRTTSKDFIENEIFDLECFDAQCDNTNLQIFDVCVATGYGAEPQDVYAVASMRPTLETLWMRVESQATITRPTPAGGSFAQQPTSGSIVAPNYIADWIETELPLTLIDGVYAFSDDPNAVAATVQVGLQPIRRVRDDSNMADVPTAFARSDSLAWISAQVPLLEKDRINIPGLGTYAIGSFYNSDVTGLAGNVLVVEKVHRGQPLS